MKAITIIATSMLLATGCATITRGSTTPFTVTSDPFGASVRFSNGVRCSTPCTVERARKAGFAVTIDLEGCETETVQVETVLAGGGAAGMAGNIIAGGIIGIGVDAVSGAAYDLSPNPLHVTLECSE